MNNKDKTKQIAAAAAGAALAYYGLKKGGAGGTIMGLMGAGLAASNLRSATGLPAGQGAEVRHSIEVEVSPKEAFDLWLRFEEYPRFMRNLIEVRSTGERTWRWAARTPFSRRVEWEIEISEVRPERLIAWRSIAGDVPARGEIRFEPAPYGARVMAVIEYGQLAGPLGALLSAVTGNNPKAMLRDDLQRFKMLVEGAALAQETSLEGYATA